MRPEMVSIVPPLRPLLTDFAKGPDFVTVGQFRQGAEQAFWKGAYVKFDTPNPPLTRFMDAAKELSTDHKITGTDKVIDLYLLGEFNGQCIPRDWLVNDETMRRIISMQIQMDLGVLKAAKLNNKVPTDKRQEMTQTIARLERIDRLLNPLGEEADFAI